MPYITYDALDDYATAVVRDALPMCLTVPCAIDAEWFAEFYLGLQVEYRRLSRDRTILGMTAFNAGCVQVYDERGLEQTIPVTAGTVIIESVLTSKRNAARRRFTVAHESAHYLIHRKAFAADNPLGVVGAFENRYLAAKTGRVDYSRSKKERTDVECMERQADFLASAILMPKPTLRMAYRDFFRCFGEKPRRIVRGVNPLDDCYARQLTEYTANIFGVSKRAALIRLEKLGAIVGKPPRGNAYA
jgi:Zn-dependent peptidase ImmA (M78 family)